MYVILVLAVHTLHFGFVETVSRQTKVVLLYTLELYAAMVAVLPCSLLVFTVMVIVGQLTKVLTLIKKEICQRVKEPSSANNEKLVSKLNKLLNCHLSKSQFSVPDLGYQMCDRDLLVATA